MNLTDGKSMTKNARKAATNDPLVTRYVKEIAKGPKIDKDRDKLCQLLYAAQTVITDYMDMTSNYDGQKLVDEIEKTLTKEAKKVLK